MAKSKRRGKARHTDAEREPNGRASRRKPREDARLVAIEARQRVYHLSGEHATHEKAGTVLGRLCLSEAISSSQHEAGERYLELYMSYLKAIRAPIGLTVSGGGGTTSDEASLEYIDWAIRAVSVYEARKADLMDDPPRWAAVDLVVIENQEIDKTGMPALLAGLALLKNKLGICD